jgi:hypothetical protein
VGGERADSRCERVANSAPAHKLYLLTGHASMAAAPRLHVLARTWGEKRRVRGVHPCALCTKPLPMKDTMKVPIVICGAGQAR